MPRGLLGSPARSGWSAPWRSPDSPPMSRAAWCGPRAESGAEAADSGRNVGFETQALRGAETAMVEEGEQIAITPVDLGANALDPQRGEVDEQLGQQGAADAVIAIIGIDADGVDHRRGIDNPELTEVDPCHAEGDRPAVMVGHPR